MDYIIGDKFVTPHDSQSEFTEKIIQLPGCYLCFSEPEFNIEVGPTPSIKNKNITFGCLNRADKISKEVISVWSQILKKVPKSQLFFRGGGYSGKVSSSIINNFESFGVEKMPEIIADISKGSYQDVLVVDKEINFIATVSNILGRI